MLPVAILAGGLATRLRPITEAIPKSLIPINGQPFIVHQLKLLRDRGIEHVVLCVGHLGGMLSEVVGDGNRFGLRVEYSFDGPAPLGTAGALQQAMPLLGNRFFALYGDSYLPCDYRVVEREFLVSRKQGLMTVFHNKGQWDNSNVEFMGGRIVDYNKIPTPAMHHIDYGLGVFDRLAFDRLPDVPADLASLYRDLLARDELASLEVNERFYEIGSFAGIQSLSAFVTA